MIWIDMEKPKFCWWLDPDNNLIAHKCPFLDREYECILQARINLTCKKRYENCPLHEVEVSVDTDMVSRQDVSEWLARWKDYISDDIIARMQYRVIDIPPLPHTQPVGTPLSKEGEE